MNKWLAFAMAFAIGGGVALAQEEQPGAKDFLAGQEAVKANNFDAAIPAFEKALAANPDLFASNYFLGWAYKAKQNWEKCGANFETFLRKVGTDPKAAEQVGHSNREGGLCYARGDSFTKAIPLLQKSASAKPNDKEVQFSLGVALMRENREGEAEQEGGEHDQGEGLGRAGLAVGEQAARGESRGQPEERASHGRPPYRGRAGWSVPSGRLAKRHTARATRGDARAERLVTPHTHSGVCGAVP